MNKKGVSWNVVFLVVFVWLSYLYISHGPDWMWFLDDVLHAMGGVILCSFSLWDSRKETMSYGTRLLLCLGFIALMSIMWEAGWYYLREAITGNLERYIAKDDFISDCLYALSGGIFRYAWYAVTSGKSELIEETS